MTTPTPADPTVPPVDPPVPEPVPDVSPTDAAIRDLATQIAALQDPVNRTTFKKAQVVASADTANPPSVSLQVSGDTTTTIAGVRYIDSYSPVVGDTVLIGSQGSDVWVLGQMNDVPSTPADQGWQTSGGVSYRKVLDNGDLKVQFKGSFTNSGTALFTLASGYFPSVTRTMQAGRNGNSTSCLVQCTTAGVLTIVGGTLVQSPTDSTDIGDPAAASGGSGTTTSAGSGVVTHFQNIGGSGNSTSSATAGSTVDLPHSHSHGGAVANTSFVAGGNHGHGMNHTHGLDHYHGLDAHDHDFTVGSHTHTLAGAHTHTITLALPTTVYFDGLEMFL